LAIGWRYYEYDGAYFRGTTDTVGVQAVWNPEQQKWLCYTGRDGIKQTIFGAPATKEEAESQHWEDGRLVGGDVTPPSHPGSGRKSPR